MLQNKELAELILQVLSTIGLPVDFKLDIRGYSRTYNGRYDPRKEKIILYSLDEEGRTLALNHLILVVIHEAVHHYQWKHDITFTRVKSVMHNEDFKSLEATYIKKYKEECVR
jgi:hypothetical protein